MGHQLKPEKAENEEERNKGSKNPVPDTADDRRYSGSYQQVLER